MPHPGRATAPALSALFVLACSGERAPTEVDPGFTVAITAPTLDVAQGGTESIVARVTRVGSFDGVVRIGAVSLPPGVTIPAVDISGSDPTRSLAVSVGFDVPVGRLVIPLRATAPGLEAVDVMLNVDVRAAPPPSIRVFAAPLIVAAVAGDSTTVRVSVERTGRVEGPITLRAETNTELPLTIRAAQIAADSPSTLLPILVDPSLPPARIGVEIIASHPATEDARVRFDVDVRRPQRIPSVFTPGSVTLTPGTPQQATLLLVDVQNEYLGPVQFQLQPTVAGLEAALVVDSGGRSATISLSAVPTLPPLAYDVRVLLKGEGSARDSAVLPVFVPPPGNLLYRFCEGGGSPTMFVFRDGEGPWQESLRFPGDRFYARIESGRGEVAWVVQDSLGARVHVEQRVIGVADLSREIGCEWELSEDRVVTGTLADARPGDFVAPTGFASPRTRVTVSGTQLRIDQPPRFFVDLFAFRPNPASGPPRLVVFTDVSEVSATLGSPIDFGAPTGRDAVVYPAVLGNATPGVPHVVTMAHGRHPSVRRFPYRTDTVAANESMFTWLGFPPTYLASNQLTYVQVRELPAPGSETERSVTRGVLGQTANLTFRLPTVPDAPSFVTSTGVQGQALVRIEPVRTVPDSAQWAFHLEQPSGVRLVLTPDKEWIASGRAVTTPDIGLATWRPEWRLRTGTPTSWTSRTVSETAAFLGNILTFQEETTVRRGGLVP